MRGRVEATAQIRNRSPRIVLVGGQATPMHDPVFVRSFATQSCGTFEYSRDRSHHQQLGGRRQGSISVREKHE